MHILTLNPSLVFAAELVAFTAIAINLQHNSYQKFLITKFFESRFFCFCKTKFLYLERETCGDGLFQDGL